MHQDPLSPPGRRRRQSRISHVFFDAEGTLWIPRAGHTFADFWAAPSAERALEVFELAPRIHESLQTLRDAGLRLVVVSVHDVRLLPEILDAFGLRPYFDDVLVNGHKGARVLQWLHAHGRGPEHAVMVGDRPDLDIEPLVTFGVRAVLVDRPYNRDAVAVRVHDLRDLAGFIGFADDPLVPVDPAHRRATDAGTWTGLAPVGSQEG